MTVTEPVYRPAVFEPDARSAFGAIVSAFEVEHAIAWCVRRWIRDYLAEISRQRQLEPELMPPFRSRVVAGALERFPEDQLPGLIVSSPGLDVRGGRVEAHGDGSMTARWRIELGSVISAAGNREAVMLARLYAAAVRVLALQQLPDPRWCPIDIRKVDWIGERYRAIASPISERTQCESVVDLIVEVEDVTNWQMGPAAPMFEPTEDEDAPEPMDLPLVRTTDTTVTHQREKL